MIRRRLLTSALCTPPLLLVGCANLNATTEKADPKRAQITVLFDAFGAKPGLKKDWGYAALVEVGGKRILFDTGNNGEIFMANAQALGVDLTRLDMVVMSHRHGDHMGGLAHLLRVNPRVPIYAPKEGFGVYGGDFPGSFYRKNEALAPEQRYYDGKPPAVMPFGPAWPGADFRLVDKNMELAPGLHLISLVSDKPGTLELRELSLAVTTPDGLVLVVGCSHPGIERIVGEAVKIDPRVKLVTGGMHMVVSSDADIGKTIGILKDQYKVNAIAPGHCTGEPAFEAMAKAFGSRYLYAGLGARIGFGAAPALISDSEGSTERPEQLALTGDDLDGYRSLYARSIDRRRKLFADLQFSTSAGGAYLGQWGRSLQGCC